MKEFIEYIVKNLVDFPDQVKIDCSENAHALIIDIHVDAKDVGKVIGRSGLVIQAIRQISTMIAARFGCHVRVNLVDQANMKKVDVLKQQL